ncbi:hypothetical protein DPEC_G00159530 [Dallia pectoralis]|uniref:Uncharacterized protein n=1 Tax=Dallia pectoralis TaxID=75939 RepID=A0ACC2GG79_DALPE|nr:hypothetical protein DPEC_G00159530 [Dallia pectoralis]
MLHFYREPASPVRGLAFGEPSAVWRNVSCPALLNRHKDLSWMVAHEILPVRAVMHSRGMGRTPKCPQPGCDRDESVRHLLWEGPLERDGPPNQPVPASRGGLNITADALRGEPEAITTENTNKALAHPYQLQRRLVGLPKPTGGEARGDPYKGSSPRGRSNFEVVQRAARVAAMTLGG